MSKRKKKRELEKLPELNEVEEEFQYLLVDALTDEQINLLRGNLK